MAVSQHRSRPTSLSVIPRQGFLLFMLALAIVAWPRLFPNPIDATAITSTRTVERQSGSEIVSSLFNQEEAGDAMLAPSESVPLKPAVSLELDGQSRDLLSLITDNTLRMARREMPAYWDLVRRSKSVSFENLRELADSKIKFNDLFSNPAKYRGGLFAFDFVVRRVNRYETEPGNPAGVDSVYEIWGTTAQSQSWPYVFITDSLPAGFNEETLVRKKTQFAGYFLKLLAYQPGSAPPNAKPLLAPMLVGQLNDIEPVLAEPTSDNSRWLSLGLTVTIVLLAAYFTSRVFWSKERTKSKRIVRATPSINPADFELDGERD